MGPPTSAMNEHKDNPEGDKPSTEQEGSAHALLPIVSLNAGLNRKASPYIPESWIKLSLTLDGRDKITKLLQYVGRFMTWYLVHDKDAASKWKAFYKKMAASRKAFRLGRSLVEVRKLQKMRLFCALFGASSTNTPKWKTLCSALKVLGTCGFWAADNVNFLASASVLDDATLRKEERQLQRQHLQRKCLLWGNRSYFYGSLAGLLANLHSYLSHRQSTVRTAMQRVSNATKEEQGEAQAELEKVQQEQFSRFVMLVKSCCDVTVFANNTGIDWFLRYRGEKLHEGLHCVGGMVSAAAVLYNNFPNGASSIVTRK